MVAVYQWPDVLGMIRLSGAGAALGSVLLGLPVLWGRRLRRESGRHLARNLPSRGASGSFDIIGGR